MGLTTSALAETLATTADGRVIRLKDDGSWEYVLDRGGNFVRRSGPLGQLAPTETMRIDPKHKVDALRSAAPPGAISLRIVKTDRTQREGCFVTVAAFNNTADRFVRFYPEMIAIDRNNTPLGQLDPKFQELHSGMAMYRESPLHQVDCDMIAGVQVNTIYACRETDHQVRCDTGDGAYALPDGVIPIVN